jgi:hypothetical protein
MNDEALKTALDALAALIRSELDGDSPARFRRITKIALQADQITRMGINRAGPAMEMDDLGEGGGLVEVGPRQMRGMQLTDGPDQAQLMREMIVAAQSIGEMFGGQIRAQARRSRAGEIQELALARRDLAGQPGADAQLVAVDEMIMRLIKEANDADVVRANVLGRHPAGSAGGPPVPRVLGEALADRDRGAGDAADGSGQEGLAGGVVP